METVVVISTTRTDYSAKAASRHSITVEELMDILSNMEPESRIVFCNDNGYTYGRITEELFDEIAWEDLDE